jgi:TDG/mug DNA glycosylase family protein
MLRGVMLPDVLQPSLRVVFCGTAAGTKSAQAGAYYAGPGNRFWPTLHQIGLTPRQLQPSEYAELPTYGIGLTDVCKTQAGADSVLAAGGFDTARLIALLEQHRPRAIAFNGKKAAQIVMGRNVSYGPQPEGIAGARVFVLPSTSGAACRYWDMGHWEELAAIVV